MNDNNPRYFVFCSNDIRWFEQFDDARAFFLTRTVLATLYEIQPEPANPSGQKAVTLARNFTTRVLSD